MNGPSYQPEYSGIEIGELGLKDLTGDELFENLLLAGANWTEEEVTMVTNSFALASLVHAEDKHRGKPYTYHLLRNANRVATYLQVTDPEIITAILLHDSVEDHRVKIIIQGNRQMDYSDMVNPYLLTPRQQQKAALSAIGLMTTERVRDGVAAVTNLPAEELTGLTDEEKRLAYIAKTAEAVISLDGFLIKISDWIDNGIGIVHSEPDQTSERHDYFSHKYGDVQPIHEARFAQADVQALLAPEAKAYLMQQFALGRQRLSVPPKENA
jgi:hypothetical protein